MIIDIGGGTTDLAIYLDGSVRRTSVIGVGGQNVTNDIAICLRTSWPLAEDLKHRHGAVLLHDISEGDEVVDDVSGDPGAVELEGRPVDCLLYTSPSPRDGLLSRMPSSA